MSASSAGTPVPATLLPQPGHRGHDGEVDVVVLGVEVEEQLIRLVDHLVEPGIGPVDLVDHDHRRQVAGERLGQDVPGLRHRPLGGVDQQQHPVDHGQRPLHLAPEVGVPRGVHQVDPRALPDDRRRLGEDGDAPLPLLVARVHDPLHLGLVVGEHRGRPEHGVDQRRLPVVDVGDERARCETSRTPSDDRTGRPWVVAVGSGRSTSTGDRMQFALRVLISAAAVWLATAVVPGLDWSGEWWQILRHRAGRRPGQHGAQAHLHRAQHPVPGGDPGAVHRGDQLGRCWRSWCGCPLPSGSTSG